MRTILVIICIAIPVLCYSQKRNNTWCFGDSAGIDFNIPSNPQPIFTGLNGRGTCVSISDTLGNLLFYAQTERGNPAPHYGQVLNKNHNVMQNGNGIIGDDWYNEMIIIPKPADSVLYYLISANVTLDSGLFYSVIDMNQSAGLGAVVQKNISIDTSSYYYDAMAAVKHGNGLDWWLICKKYNLFNPPDNYFEIYRITKDSIFHLSQSIGGNCNGNAANMTFSKDGSKLLFTTRNGIIEVLNFDRCSGLFSNPQIVHQEVTVGNYPRYWGGAFSPNQTCHR